MKKRIFPIAKLGLLLLALVFELFTNGAVMKFPDADGIQTAEAFTYFSKVPFLYGNFAPMFTAIVTCIGLVLAGLCVWLYQSRDLSAAVCFAGCIGFVLSLGPILLGKGYYTVGAFLITFLLFLQLPVYLIGRVYSREQTAETV